MLGRVGAGFRLWRVARLAWPLLKDRRVPTAVKLVPFIGLLYVLSPVDLVPDFLPALGQLDDLTLLLLSLLLFVGLCPNEVVQSHLEATERGRRRHGGRDGAAGAGPVIDGEYEVLE
jgi:uncharacterized membrane protein YkvA (DUF1232 family)